MDNVSRPLIALLVGTVAFFALWITMLKPSPSGSGSSRSAAPYQSAINKAKQAVTTSNGASVAHGGTVVTTPAAAPAAAPKTSVVTKPTHHVPAAVVKSTVAAKRRQNLVMRALSSHHVVSLLFFNPAAADDRAVRQELAVVPVRGGKVVKLAVPLNELSRYSFVTNQVPVNQSPTLVVIDRRGQAETITGFADRFEIAQRIGDALAVK